MRVRVCRRGRRAFDSGNKSTKQDSEGDVLALARPLHVVHNEFNRCEWYFHMGS